MSSKFYYLNPDKETFDIIKRYIKDINEHIDLLLEDNKIQIECIEEYKKQTGKNGNSWIKKYASEKRLYFNACKEVAVLFLATERKVTFKNFKYFIKKLNYLKENILDKIF